MIGDVSPEMIQKAQVVGQYVSCSMDLDRETGVLTIGFQSDKQEGQEYISEMWEPFVRSMAQQLSYFFGIKGKITGLKPTQPRE